LPNTKRLVSITIDHTLRSRVSGNTHARFWIGGGGSNPFADHTGVYKEEHMASYALTAKGKVRGAIISI